MVNKKILCFSVILIFLFLLSCSEKSGLVDTFGRINSQCDSNPTLAIAALDSIDRNSLTEKDRHHYDLLCIKARDKAYVRHTSDSLILDVIDYYSMHQENPLYPEALYYGARVYSDMGDLPTALEYFQTALDEIPDASEYLNLRLNALSQTGRLLEDLRLHSQATPYVEKAIEISKQHNDSVRLFYDYILLSSIYKHEDSLVVAGKFLDEAVKYSDLMQKEDKAWAEVERASLLLNEGKIDSALTIIRTLPQSVDSSCSNLAMTIAADIYTASGILDTAYYYARNLALSPEFNNRIAGFHILFSPELYAMIPQDSISFFAQAYGKHINSYFDHYESQEAMLQNSRYNYTKHNRDKVKAENEKAKAVSERNSIFIVAVILTLTLLIFIIYMRYKSVVNEMRLRMSLQLVQSICYGIKKDTPGLPIAPDSTESYFRENYSPHLYIASHKETLRKELLDGLYHIAGDGLPEPMVDSFLTNMPVVKRLHGLIDKNKGIPDNDKKIWKEIEKAVSVCAPGFKSKLMTLTMDKLTELDYQIALLIKCGIIPKNMAVLLSRSKSTITDRRTSLTKKIFGVSADNKMLDNIIHRL